MRGTDGIETEFSERLVHFSNCNTATDCNCGLFTSNECYLVGIGSVIYRFGSRVCWCKLLENA